MNTRPEDANAKSLSIRAATLPPSMHKALIFLGLEGLTSLGIAWSIFAIELWVLKSTGSYATFASLAFFAAMPGVLLSPLAGPIIDRIPRGLVLSCCDFLGIGIGASVALDASTHGFSLPAGALALFGLAVIQTLRWPTLLSTVSALAPPAGIDRVTAYEEAIEAAVTVLSPLAGTFMLSRFGIAPTFAALGLSFGASLAGVLLLRLSRSSSGNELRQLISSYASNFREDFMFGFRWIRQRPRMFRLLAYVCVFNFGATIFVTMQTPLALTLFDANRVAKIIACGGVGLLVGGIAVSLTGGIRPLTRAVYLGSACIAGAIGVYGTSGSMLQSALGAFTFTFFHPFVNTAMQVLWRSRAPLDKQGAIFSVRRMFTSALGPVAIALSVPIADHIAEPALAQLQQVFGHCALSSLPGKLGFTLVLVSAAMLLVIGGFRQLGFLEGNNE